MKIPFQFGRIHFIGIGGIGMSGLAEVLHTLGCHVSGSDNAENGNTKRLAELGLTIYHGHNENHIKNADMVVVSTAVKPDNIELVAAKKDHIPVVHRSAILAGIMHLKSGIAVSGTHGKTTTTSLIHHLFDCGKTDPTVINGGIIRSYGTNAKIGEGSWCIAESDESDGSFVHIPATAVVITNIDLEHMDYYKTEERLYEYFLRFVHNIPFYGIAVLCCDNLGVQKIIPSIKGRRFITYGVSEQADVRAVNIQDTPEGLTFSVICQHKMPPVTLKDIKLSMHGNHNVLNSLAAIVLALEAGIPEELIREGLATFKGVERRFTHVGTWNDITIIDDYAHHPAEIKAVLSTARVIAKRDVIAVFQPHRYSRVQSLFDDFAKVFSLADKVIVTDIYAAGETPIEGISPETIAENIKQYGQDNVIITPNLDDLPKIIKQEASPQDLVICLGAGSISDHARRLEEALNTL